MKKINLISTILALQLVSMSSIAGDVGPALTETPINVYVPNLKPGFEFTASALYLKPMADNLGWAAITTVLPLPTPQWQIKTIEPSYQTGFNFGARYVFANSGADIMLNWSHLHSNDKSYVTVNPATQWVSPFSQTGTLPTLTGEITGVALLKAANANLSFNYDSLTLDMGKFVNFGPSMQTRIFTGVSSAWIKEQLISTFIGFPQPMLSLNNTSSYKGIGPRLGLNNVYDVYHGINIVGQLAGSLLVGTMQPAEYRFTATASDLTLIGIPVNREAVTSASITQFVPVIDAKLGLSYVYLLKQNSLLTVELGYMGNLYVNPLSGYETNTNVIALDTGSLSTSSVRHIQSNFSVGGPYVTASLRY